MWCVREIHLLIYLNAATSRFLHKRHAVAKARNDAQGETKAKE